MQAVICIIFAALSRNASGPIGNGVAAFGPADLIVEFIVL